MSADLYAWVVWAKQWLMDTHEMASLFWIAVTLLAYSMGTAIYRRSQAHPLLLPVLTGTAAVMLLLVLTDTSYDDYFAAVHPLVFMVGPATVALAVPLFSQIRHLKAIWWPVTVALLTGSVVAILSALLIAWSFGGTTQTLLSLAPKSSTMPIATSLSAHFGGLVSLAAAAVAITGIAGTMLSGPVLKWALGPLDDVVHGFTLGLTAHAIGTARALQISETAGAFAAMAMSLNGLVTALLMPLAVMWITAVA
jgi:putative effector of murein hydrolase